MSYVICSYYIYIIALRPAAILEGTQITLFGGGAQASAIRYITNKPKLDVTGGEAHAGYGTTAGGANNSMLSAVVNVPLVADKLAARAVVFSERQGGYVDNVTSTINYVTGTVEAETGFKANKAATFTPIPMTRMVRPCSLIRSPPSPPLIPRIVMRVRPGR